MVKNIEGSRKKGSRWILFKSSYNRIIYLSKTEIKEFQKIKGNLKRRFSIKEFLRLILRKIPKKIVIEDLIIHQKLNTQ